MCLVRWALALVFSVAVMCCPGFPSCFPESRPWVLSRHGMITGFKVYRGLEKSRFQNHKNVTLYHFCSRACYLPALLVQTVFPSNRHG